LQFYAKLLQLKLQQAITANGGASPPLIEEA
jgi:hypothetical protein